MRIRKALPLCLFMAMRLVYAIDDTLTIVDGISTNIGAFIPSGTNNVLIVTNGGLAAVTTFASQSGARSNAVFVVGSGSMISNSPTLTFASSGISNALVLRDGGSMARNLTTGGTNNLVLIENTTLRVPGLTLGGRSNQYVLKNASIGAVSCQINTLFGHYLLSASQWTNSDFQTSPARTNEFVLSEGSAIFADHWEFSGIGNRLQVMDPDSLWKVTNILAVINSGTVNPGQIIQISAGASAEVMRDFDLGFSSSYNQLTADGAGSLITVGGALNIGVGPGGRSNAVTVSGGATLKTDSATIGSGIANSVTVTGNGSFWSNAKSIQLNEASNRIDVLDGGAIASLRLSNNGKSNVITVAPSASLIVTGDLSVAKSLKVTGGGSLRTGQYLAAGPAGQNMEIGGGSTWTVSSNLSFSTSGNTLAISEGATVQGVELDMGLYANAVESAFSNVVVVTGPNSSLSLSSIVMTSRWQNVYVEKGARLKSGAFTSMRGNTIVDISGGNSMWENAGDLLTGSFATNDIFRVTGGALATNGSATIGVAASGPVGFRSYSAVMLDGTDSHWITATNLIVGFNANSNSFSISNGALCLVSNLVVGYGTNKSLSVSGGSENALIIDGVDSQLTADGIIRLGYGSSSNVFAVTGGATVSARAFTAGEAPPNTPVSINMLSNVVSVTGANSRLTLSSNLSIGGNSHLVLSNAAQIVAGGPVVLGNNASIRAQSQLTVTGGVLAGGKELLVEDAGVRAAELQFSAFFEPIHARITGSQTLVEIEAIHIARVDPRAGDLNGQATFDVLNSANISTRWLTIGLNARTNPPVMNIDGGFITVAAPGGAGLVELDHGTLNIRHGALRADELRVESNDSTINGDGALLVAAGPNEGDGDLRIGADRGEVQLRGTNRFSKLLVGTAPGAAGLLTIQNGGQVHAGGEMIFGAGAELRFIAENASGPIALVADGPVTLGGRLTVAATTNSTLQQGDAIVLLTGANILGGFANAVSGSRILTADGTGSFLLNISATAVSLTDFQSEIRLNVSFDAGASNLRLTFATALSATVQTSTNLVEWFNLENAPSQTVGDQTQVDLPLNFAEPQRYYRLRR